MNYEVKMLLGEKVFVPPQYSMSKETWKEMIKQELLDNILGDIVVDETKEFGVIECDTGTSSKIA